MEYRECGYRLPYFMHDCYSWTIRDPNVCTAVGCYCKDGYGLNETTGLCTDRAIYMALHMPCLNLRKYRQYNILWNNFHPLLPFSTSCLHVHIISTETPGCVKLGELVVITWNADAHREYTYTLKDSSGIIIRSKSLSL